MENEIVNMPKAEVSVLEKIVSFLFPIIGLILYLVFTNERENPKEYLRFAGLGIVIGILLTCLSTCVGCVSVIGAASAGY